MKKSKQFFTMIAVLAMVFIVGATAYAAGDVELREEVTQEEGRGRRSGGKGPAAQQGQKGTELFESAIEAGIITEVDVEAIEAHREANRPDMEAVKEATEGMTREEVKAYMEATYGPKPEPFEGLVEDGILTQDQVDALLELAPEKGEGQEAFRGKGQKGIELFESAIEAGIITAADVEAIEAHREANQPDMDVVKEATEGMTREEVKAYMEATYGPKGEPFEGLVEDGILSQDQVNQLLELVPEKPEQVDGGQGQRGNGGMGRPSNDGSSGQRAR